MPSLDGGRAVRVRYDTPSFAGFTLSGSRSAGETLGNGSVSPSTDSALRYQSPDGTSPFGNRAICEVQAGIGYLRNDGAPHRDIVSGSVSVLLETGWNATIAGGVRDAETGADGGYGYVRIGWRGRLVPLGETAFSADLYSGAETATGMKHARAVGIEAVQVIDSTAVEVFAGVRRFQTDGPVALKDATSILGGFRVRF